MMRIRLSRGFRRYLLKYRPGYIPAVLEGRRKAVVEAYAGYLEWCAGE